MPVITAFKPQKNKKVINVFIDGKFGFSVDLENFVKLRIKVGQRFSTDELKKVVAKSEYQKVLIKLLDFTSLRPRSEKEVDVWMVKKSVKEKFKEELKNKLRSFNLLDDEKFAKWWIEQRIAFNHKSKREIYYELKVKGVEKEIIINILSDLKVNELQSARILLKKSGYKWRKYPKKVVKQKMSAFLARKGFTWATIKTATEEV